MTKGNKKLLIASDHGGYRLKEVLREWLKSEGYKVTDLGSQDEKAPDDYPDFGRKLCHEVLKSDLRGILICGAGVGMSMVANKFKGIRAAAAANCYMARMSRFDNNSNVLCLGQRVLGEEFAKDIVKIWLETDFSTDERHRRRVAKIDQV